MKQTHLLVIIFTLGFNGLVIGSTPLFIIKNQPFDSQDQFHGINRFSSILNLRSKGYDPFVTFDVLPDTDLTLITSNGQIKEKLTRVNEYEATKYGSAALFQNLWIFSLTNLMQIFFQFEL